MSCTCNIYIFIELNFTIKEHTFNSFLKFFNSCFLLCRYRNCLTIDYFLNIFCCCNLCKISFIKYYKNLLILDKFHNLIIIIIKYS